MSYKTKTDRRQNEAKKRRYNTKKRILADWMKVIRLSKLQKRIISFCHSFALENKWAPAWYEIREHCKIKEYNTVIRNLRKLHDNGWITYMGNRQIKVLMLP